MKFNLMDKLQNIQRLNGSFGGRVWAAVAPALVKWDPKAPVYVSRKKFDPKNVPDSVSYEDQAVRNIAPFHLMVVAEGDGARATILADAAERVKTYGTLSMMVVAYHGVTNKLLPEYDGKTQISVQQVLGDLITTQEALGG